MPSANNFPTILVVEDEPKLAQVIVDYLNANSFTTIWLQDGSMILDVIRNQSPSLILLDIMLPGKDGFVLCEDIRKISQVPIVMLTARIQDQDRLQGFEIGADDYICKPFNPRELVFRIKAILKRTGLSDTNTLMPVSKLQFDFNSYTVKLDGQSLGLTSIEFGILSTLAQAPGRVFSRDTLLDRVYPTHRIINDRAIDSHIKNLRRKIKAVKPDAEIVQSIYGLGYKVDLS